MRFTVLLILSLFIYSGCYAQFTALENFKFGKTKFDEANYYEAIDFLNNAISLDSLNENSYFLRGQTYLLLKNYDHATEDFSFLIKHRKTPDASLSEYYFYRGIARIENKEFFSAKDDFEMALKLNPSNPDIYYEQSRLKFFTMNDKSEAIIDLDKAIQLNSLEPRYYLRRAEYKASESMDNFSALEPLKSAISDMDIAILLDSANYSYYQFRAELNKKAGEPMNAVKDYSKMIHLDPDDFDAYTERGVIEMQFDDYKNAIKDFSSAISKHPDDDKNFRYRALCRHNSSDFMGAYTDYSSAILLLSVKLRNIKEKQTIQRILADTYVKRGASATSMGNNFNACDDFRTAYELGSAKALNYFRKYCGF